MTMRLALALSLALVPALALAAPASKSAAAPARSEAPTRIYDFDPDDVDGESLRPEGVDVQHRGKGTHESLIKVRTHFIPQMLKMAIDV
jgi:hypothetical protein